MQKYILVENNNGKYIDSQGVHYHVHAVSATVDGSIAADSRDEAAALLGVAEDPAREQHLILLQRQRLVAAVRRKRQDVEQGGFAFNGLMIPSDRESQAMINGAVVAAKDDGEFSTQWQVDDTTFVALNSAQIIAMGQALRDHVSGAFNWQADKVAEILAAQTLQQLGAIQV